MLLLIKTEMDMYRLTTKLNELRTSEEHAPVHLENNSGKAPVGYLMPPDIGQLVLYRNSDPVQFAEVAEWPYVLEVRKMPVQSKVQEEIAWTQLKMLGAYLRVNNIASAVLAVQHPKSGIERVLTE
ncbi:MAG: hypothetical protein M9920_12240 [Verrucomicrobiae bacterium]|nr:hypothetical protein [Verrucomicrobiae bacterium]